MNKHINTRLAKYQIQQLNKQAIVSHARPFDLSIAQLENWPIRPIRTRRNGSTGLRRDIKRCIQSSVSIAQSVWKACDPLLKLLKKANTSLEKVQLSHAETLQTQSVPTQDAQAQYAPIQGAQAQSVQAQRVKAETEKTTEIPAVHLNKRPQQDVLFDTPLIQNSNSARRVSIRPMQEIAQPNLLKDGLATAIWIIMAPTVLILGTVAGY